MTSKYLVEIFAIHAVNNVRCDLWISAKLERYR